MNETIEHFSIYLVATSPLEKHLQVAARSMGRCGLKAYAKYSIVIFVDTRFGRQVRAKSARSRREEEKRIPAMDRCIMTKYAIFYFTIPDNHKFDNVSTGENQVLQERRLSRWTFMNKGLLKMF